MEKKRKLAFYEIDRGRLAEKMQQSFEKVQKAAFDTGSTAEVTLKIRVFPSEDSKFGQVDYHIAEKMPAHKSIKLTTELNQGLMTADGRSVIDVLQEELEFDEPTILNIQQGGE